VPPPTVSAGESRSAPEVTLQRGLGLRDATMIGVGAMVGAGIFALTGMAAGAAGPALTVAFLLNGLVAGSTAMAYAELGAAFPRAGGSYVWTRLALPAAGGFLTGWMSWVATTFACALYAQTFGAYFGVLLTEVLHLPLPASPVLMARVLAVLVAVAFTAINARGSSETGAVGTAVTLAKLTVLVVFGAAGLWVLAHRAGLSGRLGLTSAADFFPRGAFGVVAAMGITYVAFEGYEIIAQGGEEIRNPRRTIPRAIFLSLAIVLPLYLLISIVCLGAVRSPDGMATWRYLGSLPQPELAVLEAAKAALGPALGMVLILFGALMSTMSALNATVYSSSRVAFAMARDATVPTALARVHPTRRTPHVAIWVSGAAVALMAALLPIESVAAGTSLLFLLTFTLVNFAAIALRYQRPRAERPFRIIGFPVSTLLAILASLSLCIALAAWNPLGAVSAGGWIVFGAYVFFHHSRTLEKEEHGSKVVLEEREVTRPRCHVVVLLADPRSVRPLIRVAAAVSKAIDSAILAVRIVQVPRQLPIAEGRRFVDAERPLLDSAVKAGRACGVAVYTMVRVAQRIDQAALETLTERRTELVLLGWRGGARGRKGHVLGSVLDSLILRAPCDVGILRAQHDLKCKSVLVGVTASPHAKLAVEVGEAIARECHATVRNLHVVKQGTGMDPKTIRAYLSDEARERGAPAVEVVEAESTADGLIEQARRADLLVIGSAREPLLQRYLLGDKTQRVARAVRCPVLIVKRHPSAANSILRRLFAPYPETADAEEEAPGEE
jgi:amino acid transporter/nucleotide-binding universal stress UspA family protein